MSHGLHDPGHNSTPRHGDPDTAMPEMTHGGGWSYDVCAAVFFGGRRRRIFGRLASESGARPGDRVLDVGCGTGYFTRVMAQAIAPGGSARGVDRSGEAITHARRLTHLANCTFDEGIAEALDALDCSHDVVVSSLMIHHLPEPVRPEQSARCSGVLRPGGSVLIAEFRPPASRIGRRVVKALTGHHAMAENRVELLEPMIREAGFVRVHTGNLRPWTYFIQARKPGVAG
jgi:ubiquinone/menaquinone biosynthesis C-methylase UbiE